MNAKTHYDHHLARVYSWMTGDFATRQHEQVQFLEKHQIFPGENKTAIDLGAGHGIQSTALAKLGFSVTAVDFSRDLLGELEQNAIGLDITLLEKDILHVRELAPLRPALMTCWGDTLTHLGSLPEAENFIGDCCAVLEKNGLLLLSFRDYTQELTGTSRFIPVKSDENRILTCFLEYGVELVTVHDLLYERTALGWEQKISAYPKLRLAQVTVQDWLGQNEMKVLFNEPVNRMVTMIAQKV